MRYLEAIRVVQFFLFEKQEIRLGEIAGVFGPNGSGKSSLLDAIQIAMMGGNSRYVALNAQADEKTTTRSLRAYCLGQYGETTEQRARENSTTYISLIWRDEETKAPLSMGVCLRASSDREGHEVLGRYILPGIELSMGDHLEVADSQERPREWSTFRHQLIERAKVSGEDPVYPDSDRYIRAALLALRGSGSSASPEAFIRAFKFALRMRFDKAVHDIVREDVLESRPTNIRKFKEVTESFRRLADLVAQVEAKIARAERVRQEYDRAAAEARHVATWELLSKKSAAEVAQEKLDQASGAVEQVEEQLRKLESTHSDLNAKAEEARNAELHVRSQREAHSAHKDYGVLRTEIQSATEKAQQKRKELSGTIMLVRNALQQAAGFESLNLHKQSITAICVTLGEIMESIAKQEVSRESVMLPLGEAVKVADAAFKDLLAKRSAIGNELGQARTQEKIAKDDLGRVKSGRAPLSPDVQRLLTDLHDHGVQATPVCDLVRIKDAEWQPAIESYLKSNTEALLVAAGYESDAFRIYRDHKTVYGVKIVMESREVTGRTHKPGTVAALIEGDHPAAVAFLQRQFGDMLCASSNTEALGSESNHRSLTKDGMLVSGAHFERMRPTLLSNLRIGAGGQGQREAMERALDAASNQVLRLEKVEQRLEDLRLVLQRVATEDAVAKHAASTWDSISESIAIVETKTIQMKGAADEDYNRLSEEENHWSQKVAALSIEREALRDNLVRAEESKKQLDIAQLKAKQTLDEAVVTVNAARANPDVDPEFETRQWDMLIEKYDSNCEAMGKHADEQQYNSQRRMTSAITSGSRELGIFLAEHREHIPQDISNNWTKERAWISDLLKNLNDTQLVPYKEDMDAAYRTSQETFRNDVAIALNNNIEWLDDTMNRLNAVLRDCPAFSNGERYRFRRQVRPPLDSLLRFIKNVASHGPTEDLLGGPGVVPPEFRELLEDKVAAGNAGVKSPLDDYREFFEFDIEILREDLETKSSKVVGHLSKRLGPGSGGEHRAPLYVIAGAALASAYRLDRGQNDGIRLMLLDEAFNKMDHTNIVATMRYLEELGLQVFMASPGENLGVLTAFLHRYYDILRDVDNNAVMIEGRNVSKETRALFRMDLPDFNPGLVDQELANVQSLTEMQQAGAAS